VFGTVFLVLLLAPAAATAGSRLSQCGGANQRPCRLWEAIPSCDGGLYEDFLRDRCIAPGGGGAGDSGRPSYCGHEDQRPCTIVEFIPSCDPGLVENFIDGRCVAPGGGSQPGDVLNAFHPPNCNQIFGDNNIFGTSLNALYTWKLGPEFLASLGWDATIPKDTLGTPARVVGALAYYAVLYCGLALERDLALQSEAEQAANFEAVHGGLAGLAGTMGGLVQANAALRQQVLDLDAALADRDAALARQVADLDAALAGRDAETTRRLADLGISLREVVRLLNTPQGRRPDFPAGQ
jgi:hypothetical protein